MSINLYSHKSDAPSQRKTSSVSKLKADVSDVTSKATWLVNAQKGNNKLLFRRNQRPHSGRSSSAIIRLSESSAIIRAPSLTKEGNHSGLTTSGHRHVSLQSKKSMKAPMKKIKRSTKKKKRTYPPLPLELPSSQRKSENFGSKKCATRG